MASEGPVREDPVIRAFNKRYRALRKEFVRIYRTELSVSRGQKMNPQQEKLLYSKPDVIARMDELRNFLQLICDSLEEEFFLSPTTRQASSTPPADEKGLGKVLLYKAALDMFAREEHNLALTAGEIPYASVQGVRERIYSPALSDIGMEVQSGSSKAPSSCGLSPPLRIEPVLQSSSSSCEDIMFVVYSRKSTYIVKAFGRSAKLNPDYSFSVNLFSTPLPYNSGFGAVASTLYMIGGTIFDKLSSAYVANLVTYKIEFCKILQFPNKSIPPDFGDLVQAGPLLQAKKASPIVIVVGSQIYAFNRFLLVKEESPKNFECLKTEAQEWELLPEPPFRRGPGKGIFRHYEIESHVVIGEDFIVIRITGEGNPGMFKLDIGSHEWSHVDPEGVKFSGRGVSFNNVYYGLMDRRINNLENRVVYFRSPVTSPEVEEVADIQPYPGEVHWLHQCEFASTGASIFIARTGYSSMLDHVSEIPPHSLSVEEIEVSTEAGKSKAIKTHTHTLELEVRDSVYSSKALYIVRWVRSG